jgi:ABC-type nickel/cobalt efflux system permease component RcnA
LLLGLLLAGGWVTASALKAHPLAEVRFDRTIAVRLSTVGVEVTYTLDVSVLGMHLDAARRLTPQEVARMERTLRGYATAYAHKAAEEVQGQMRVLVDGQPLKLELIHWEVTLSDHPSCRYLLRGRWPEGKRERLVQIEDRTFEDYPGVVHLTVATRGGERDLEILDLEEPPLRLRSRPIEQLSAEEAFQARRARVEILLPAERVTSSPEAGPSSEPVLPRADPLPDVPSANWWTDLRERGLLALFDSHLGWGVLLLLAFLFGAAHAFTPGHGKTLVAAYLIGERGTVRHACLLALTTTVAHTGSVFLVALVLWLVYGTQIPAVAHGLLQLAAGVLVVGVGIWLLSRRLAGQADHFHLFGDHHHHHPHSHFHSHSHSHSHFHFHPHSHPHSHSYAHSHSHSHAPQHRRQQQQLSGSGGGQETSSSSGTGEGSTIGWLRLVLMGLGGGLVPCWDAVLLLVAASALGRLDAAIPLLLAFSLGLGTVLVALGVAVVYALRAGQHHFSESRWFRMLPTFSATLLVGLGLWLCQNALVLLGTRAG